MKILHCSDVHLGRRPAGAIGEYSRKRYDDYFAAFDWAVGTAIERKIDVVLISGDFFDKKELLPEVLQRTEKSLQKLKDADISVILIEGNHDNIVTGNESDSWLIYLENKGLFRRPYLFFNDGYNFNKIEIDNINFYGIGYPGSMVDDTLKVLSEFLEDKKHEKNIILVHTAIKSGDLIQGAVRAETVELFNGKALYIAGGHFHSFNTYPKENPYFFRPGSLEYWDTKEFDNPKGVIIFDTETKEHEFLESVKRHAVNKTLKISGNNFDEFMEDFARQASHFEIIKGETMINLTLNLENSYLVDMNILENFLNEMGFLKSFIKINLPGSEKSMDLNNPLLGIEQVEREIIKEWKYFSDDLEQTALSLELMKEHQETKNEDLFFETFNSLLDRIIESGATK